MSTKDYLRSKHLSEQLADTIRDYYHSRGYTGVKVWVEADRPTTDFGTKLPTVYSVRSNISFSVASIPKGMLG